MQFRMSRLLLVFDFDPPAHCRTSRGQYDTPVVIGEPYIQVCFYLCALFVQGDCAVGPDKPERISIRVIENLAIRVRELVLSRGLPGPVSIAEKKRSDTAAKRSRSRAVRLDDAVPVKLSKIGIGTTKA